tara:strand:- start:477 stop:767 length:291 start_codon:yes stop_codon:yes gene_type:complete
MTTVSQQKEAAYLEIIAQELMKLGFDVCYTSSYYTIRVLVRKDQNLDDAMQFFTGDEDFEVYTGKEPRQYGSEVSMAWIGKTYSHSIHISGPLATY